MRLVEAGIVIAALATLGMVAVRLIDGDRLWLYINTYAQLWLAEW